MATTYNATKREALSAIKERLLTASDQHLQAILTTAIGNHHYNFEIINAPDSEWPFRLCDLDSLPEVIDFE
jgi:hypothetical protein